MTLNQNTKILVTGGAGFVGSNIVEALIKKNCTVRIVDNFSTGREENIKSFVNDVEIYRTDIRNIDDLKKASKGVDIVFHTAAIPSVPRSVKDPLTSCEVNIQGSINVFEAARYNQVKRIVYSASSSAYGDTEALPKEESMKPQPLSPYAVAKLVVEQLGTVYSLIYNIEAVSLRYFNVFGPRQDPNSDYAAVIPKFMDSCLKNEAPIIFGDGEQTRDFTFVRDVVDANLLAATTPGIKGEVFNIAGGKRITINDLAKNIASLCGKDIQPKHTDSRPGDIKHSLASIEKAKKQMSWQPQYNLEEGLKLTLQWFQNSDQ